MREVQFRGKCADNGEWVYGSLTQFFDDGIAYICGQRDEVDPVMVDFETVGQMTGIDDKHGNPIFEGDIVRWKIGSIKCVGVVAWGTGEWVKGNQGHNMQSLRTYQGSTEIIGTINDSPELLRSRT